MEEEKTFEQRVDETVIYSPSLAINLRKFLKELYNNATTVNDVPLDNVLYGRKNKEWVELLETIQKTSQLINDGEDGLNTFITSLDLPTSLSELLNDTNFITLADVPPSVFEEDIQVVLSSGKSLGKYTTGQTINSAGKTFEAVLKDIALEYVNPTFTSFTITGQPTTVEVGTTLSGSKTFNWGITLNSGIVPTVDIYDNTAGVPILTGTPNDGNQSQTIITNQLNSNGATQSWKGIGNNTNGSNINSGNFTVRALFNRYWGAVATLPVSSVDGTANRTYANSLEKELKSNGSNTFTLSTGIIENKFIVLLPPGVTIVSVIDTGNLNGDRTSDYVLSTITIKDAGGTDRTYNQYLFNPAGAYSVSTNHVITTN